MTNLTPQEVLRHYQSCLLQLQEEHEDFPVTEVVLNEDQTELVCRGVNGEEKRYSVAEKAARMTVIVVPTSPRIQ